MSGRSKMNERLLDYMIPHGMLLDVRVSPKKTRAVMVMNVWSFDLQLLVQSTPITTNVVSSSPTHGEVYLIQHYVITLCDLQQISGFLWVLQFPLPIKLTSTISLKY
jgi:hypothetical protein